MFEIESVSNGPKVLSFARHCYFCHFKGHPALAATSYKFEFHSDLNFLSNGKYTKFNLSFKLKN